MTLSEIDAIVGAFMKDGARPSQVKTELMPAPHRPAKLPQGWQGVYAFRFQNVWLKVGKAGPYGNARWTSQHYNSGSAISNLAWSLLRYAHLGETDDPRLPASLRVRLQGIHPNEIGDWIKQHTDRCNIMIDMALGKESLAVLERIAIDALMPVFEGRWAFGGIERSPHE